TAVWKTRGGLSRGQAMPRHRSNGAIVIGTALKKPAVKSLPVDIGDVLDPVAPRPSRSEAEAAVRTRLAYIGENPARKGLVDTPKRVVSAFEELYGGYRGSGVNVVERTFCAVGHYMYVGLILSLPIT